jgi:hypothetical protein
MRIIEIFEAPLYVQFEAHLQDHPSIAQHVFKDAIHNNHHSNKEVFLMTPSDLEQTIRIAKARVHRFCDTPTVDQLVEVERLRLETAMLEAAARRDDQPEASAPVAVTFFDPSTERRFRQSRGKKVQRYTPDGKELLKTYPGFADVSRDAEVDQAGQQQMRNAISANNVYKSFRWASLDRSLPDDTVQDLEPTVVSKTVHQGRVAMLDLTKTRIVEVFQNSAAAAENRQFSNGSAISRAMKGSQSGGHYFMPYFDCTPEMKAEYLSRAVLPESRVRSNGKVIEQLHPVTGALVKRFSSIAHVMRDMRIARLSLKDAMEFGSVAKAHKWREVPASSVV